jgi:hypothetical protein
MSRNIPQINTTDTFQVWLQRTNDVISEIGSTVVTASTLGDSTVGNATLFGSFTANTVVAHNLFRTNIIDTKVGNTSPITVRGAVDITASGNQTPLTIKNSLGPRISIENNSIAWQVGLRGSAGTGTNAEFVIGVEGSDFALRIGADGILRANTILLTTESSSTTSAVRSDRIIKTNNGLTGGGNLTADRTIGLTGNALSLHQLVTTGIVVRNATNSLVTREIKPGPGINVTQGAGISDNPTISVDSTVVRTTGNVTIGGNKIFSGTVTFNNTIDGSISGNAATVTNGVYTTGNQNIDGIKTFYDAPVIGVTNDGAAARREVLIRSQGYAGIKINGDVSNLAGEPGGSYVTFGVDGTVIDSVIGTNNGSDFDRGPDGTTLSGGVPANAMVLGTYGSNSVRIVVNKALAATFDTSKNLVVVGNVSASSDARLKSNIRTIESAVEKVCGMRGVYFTKDGSNGVGVIAQEVEAVVPEAVFDDEMGYKSVAYGNLVGVLIEAIKELKSEIEVLKGSQRK